MPSIYDTDQGGIGGSQINTPMIGGTTGGSSQIGIDESGNIVDTGKQGTTIRFLNFLNTIASPFTSFFTKQVPYNIDSYQKDALNLAGNIAVKSSFTVLTGLLGSGITNALLWIGNAVSNSLTGQGITSAQPKQPDSSSMIKAVVIIAGVFLLAFFLVKQLLKFLRS